MKKNAKKSEPFFETTFLATLTASVLAIGTFSFVQPSQASGIFSLRGKLKGFTEELYLIETKSLVYEIKKAELSSDQLQEMKKKKAGHEIELVVATEAVSRVRDKD